MDQQIERALIKALVNDGECLCEGRAWIENDAASSARIARDFIYSMVSDQIVAENTEFRDRGVQLCFPWWDDNETRSYDYFENTKKEHAVHLALAITAINDLMATFTSELPYLMALGLASGLTWQDFANCMPRKVSRQQLHRKYFDKVIKAADEIVNADMQGGEEPSHWSEVRKIILRRATRIRTT